MKCENCGIEVATPYMVIFPDDDGIPADEHLVCYDCFRHYYVSPGIMASFFMCREYVAEKTRWHRAALIGDRIIPIDSALGE